MVRYRYMMLLFPILLLNLMFFPVKIPLLFVAFRTSSRTFSNNFQLFFRFSCLNVSSSSVSCIIIFGCGKLALLEPMNIYSLPTETFCLCMTFNQNLIAFSKTTVNCAQQSMVSVCEKLCYPQWMLWVSVLQHRCWRNGKRKSVKWRQGLAKATFCGQLKLLLLSLQMPNGEGGLATWGPDKSNG